MPRMSHSLFCVWPGNRVPAMPASTSAMRANVAVVLACWWRSEEDFNFIACFTVGFGCFALKPDRGAARDHQARTLASAPPKSGRADRGSDCNRKLRHLTPIKSLPECRADFGRYWLWIERVLRSVGGQSMTAEQPSSRPGARCHPVEMGVKPWVHLQIDRTAALIALKFCSSAPGPAFLHAFIIVLRHSSRFDGVFLTRTGRPLHSKTLC